MGCSVKLELATVTNEGRRSVRFFPHHQNTSYLSNALSELSLVCKFPLHSNLMDKILSHGDRTGSSEPHRGAAVFRGSAYLFLTPHCLFLTSSSTSRKEQATLNSSVLLFPVLYLRAVWRNSHSSGAGGFDCQLTSNSTHCSSLIPTPFRNILRPFILSHVPFSYPFCQLYSPSLLRFIYLSVLSHHSTGTRES